MNCVTILIVIVASAVSGEQPENDDAAVRTGRGMWDNFPAKSQPANGRQPGGAAGNGQLVQQLPGDQTRTYRRAQAPSAAGGDQSSFWTSIGDRGQDGGAANDASQLVTSSTNHDNRVFIKGNLGEGRKSSAQQIRDYLRALKANRGPTGIIGLADMLGGNKKQAGQLSGIHQQKNSKRKIPRSTRRMDTGQAGFGSGRRGSSAGFARRQGIEDVELDDYEYLDDGPEFRTETVPLEDDENQRKQNPRLPPKVNAASVLEMIKGLQQEIQELDEEIEKESFKIQKMEENENIQESEDDLEDGGEDKDEFPPVVSSVAKESAKETMKELALQKEDTTMKKVIAQMMLMKQIQSKKEESEKLEVALAKLAERRKAITSALKKQKEIAEEKRQEAQVEINRQKDLMTEKERIIEAIIQKQEEERLQRIREREREEELEREREAEREREKEKEQERRREREKEIEKQKELEKELKRLRAQREKDLSDKLRLEQEERKPKPDTTDDILQKTQLLEAHMRLVDRSNERILARIEELKLQRQREAIAEQERLLLEQEAAITALSQMKKKRRKEQKKVQQKTEQSSRLTIPKGLRLQQTAALLSLSDGERKQVAEWLDLEKNAEILAKTDQKIADKLRLKQILKNGRTPSGSSALKVKNAAQILLDADDSDSITDAEIDSILGLNGIDSGLTDILGLDNPDILQLDDDSLLFEDYEEGDSDDYDYDYDYEYDDEDYEYDEKIYDYEYEDEVAPPVSVLRVVGGDTVRPAPPPPPPVVHRPRKRPYQRPPARPYHAARPPVHQHRPAYPKPAAYGHRTSPARGRRPVNPPPGASTGAQFLGEVQHILGEAEHNLNLGIEPHITLTGSLREALLREVGDTVHTEINRLPGGRVSTKVSIGAVPPAPPPVRGRPRNRPLPPGPPITSQRVLSTSPRSFSDLVPPQQQRLRGDESFGTIMADLLEGKPQLPPGLGLRPRESRRSRPF